MPSCFRHFVSFVRLICFPPPGLPDILLSESENGIIRTAANFVFISLHSDLPHSVNTFILRSRQNFALFIVARNQTFASASHGFFSMAISSPAFVDFFSCLSLHFCNLRRAPAALLDHLDVARYRIPWRHTRSLGTLALPRTSRPKDLLLDIA
jgi:hypothetical protein